MEKEESCFAKIKGYLKAKFGRSEAVAEEEAEKKSATLKSNTNAEPPLYYLDPLCHMYLDDPSYHMDLMDRYDRMMMLTGRYDPELDEHQY